MPDIDNVAAHPDSDERVVLYTAEAFHIHTYRCGHAEMVPDEAYIEKGIELGAGGIWFSDHAPFPGDPFRNRMRISELEEYLNTLTELKSKYEHKIPVHIGLEIEYLPAFDEAGYYQSLRGDKRIDFLILGQHMAETQAGHYTFEWEKERLIKEEYLALGEAVVSGINAGYFDYVAHPDRIFRRKKLWDADMDEISEQITELAGKSNIPLEINMHSVAMKNQFRPEFWMHLTNENKVVRGLDAHSIAELERRYARALPIT